ncbi:hypothetical protein RQM59_11380 [Flavobacteriaceae bacterium S356]|uniref:AMP-activated protein kinase glycogen-binding domain-containing protein n=1 Tax=Asprobacillus argus TaxID=3076534 RepID=A0ABU3LGX8_9FLAO|nr:hypothetical protein [Flavobacteriaceae bacterium S356]
MKLRILHIIIFICSLSMSSMHGQKDTIKGYQIDGDYIVFRFNKSDYIKATNDHTEERIDFKDLNIKEVFVAGSFNDWSRNQWKMKQVSENIYELRKKLSDLNEFTPEFKFVVNEKYWAEPTEEAQNITAAKSYDGIDYYTYNFKILLAYPSKKGNYTFRLPGYNRAKKVILSGSFNKWDEDDFKMNRTENGWELTLQLKPSYYEYKFIVDGEWMEDPENKNKAINEFGGFNSCIDIKKNVSFILEKFKDAKSVILTGSFNDWDETLCPMKKTAKGWIYTIQLSAGKHHYKYIIDGKWVIDPDNSVKEYDLEGNINSVKMVK